MSIDKPSLTEEQVAQFLEQNPKFFEGRDALLEKLVIPHASGKATSLLERQMHLYRDKSTDLGQRLSSLLDTARLNDRLFEKTKKAVLDLLASQNLDDIVANLKQCLQEDFDVDICTFTLFGEDDILNCVNARILDTHSIQTANRLFKGKRALVGRLSHTELNFIFGKHGQEVASAAATCLVHHQAIGILALGSRDPNHFRHSLGTLFLSFLGDVLSLLLPRFLPAGHPAALTAQYRP